MGHGGKEPILLPRGVVCDPCNNAPLSRLDQALIEFDFVSMVKTLYGVPSKTGKRPRTIFGNNASLTNFAEGHVLFESNNKSAWISHGDGRATWNLMSKRPIDSEYRRQLAILERFAAGPSPTTPAERASGLTVDAGIRSTKARIEWAEAAIDEVGTW